MEKENKGGNRLMQVHLEKWPLKRSVCVRTSEHSFCCESLLLTYLLTDVIGERAFRYTDVITDTELWPSFAS